MPEGSSVPDARLMNNVFDSFPTAYVEEWRVMSGTPSDKWASFMTSGCDNPTFWDEFIKPLQAWFAQQGMQRLSGVAGLLRRVDEEGGAALAEVKAVIANVPADMQAALKHLVRAMADFPAKLFKP